MRDGQSWRNALHQVLRCLPNDFTASGRALGEYLNLPGLADVLACQLIGLALGSGHVFGGRGPFGLRLRPGQLLTVLLDGSRARIHLSTSSTAPSTLGLSLGCAGRAASRAQP